MVVLADNNPDRTLGTGEARQEYYHCESLDEAKGKWSELLGEYRQPILCRACIGG